MERNFFTFAPVLSHSPPPLLIFLNTTLKCLRSSTVKYSNSMRRSNSSSFVYKRQRGPSYRVCGSEGQKRGRGQSQGRGQKAEDCRGEEEVGVYPMTLGQSDNKEHHPLRGL